MVLVNHYANAAAALIFEAADHAAVAVNLHIAPRTHNVSRKQNGELHQRTHGDVVIHREEPAAGGNVCRLPGTISALRSAGNGHGQRKPRCTPKLGLWIDP